jgi:hypothetical protein
MVEDITESTEDNMEVEDFFKIVEEDLSEMSLAQLFTDIIIHSKNQNVICLFEGKPGMGKSNATMNTACWCAVQLANHFGGVPSNYFNIGHIATIAPDQVMRCINVMRRPSSHYGVFVFDDFGVAYNNRKWQSKPNEAMNDVLQTMRTDNNIIFMSVPDSDWIDIKGRNILRFKIVMDKPIFSKQLERIGKSVAVGRLTEVQKMYNTSSRKNIYPYIKTKGAVYNKIIFGKAPNELEEIYEAVRKIQLRRVQLSNVEAILDGMTPKEKSDKSANKKVPDDVPKKVTKKARCLELIRDVEAGVYGTLKAACAENSIDYGYARKVSAGRD